MRTFLTVIMGAMLLGGCAAKSTATSARAVSAQDNKDTAACLEQPLKKESYEEHQKSFVSCMRAKGYHEEKLYPSDTTANARSPLISDGLKNLARESSPDLAASEEYERAVADYNNCVLEHTSNLSACAKQQTVMNGLGKISSRLSSSERYQIRPRSSQTTNTAEITQGGANSANITQATLSQDAARIPQTAQATPSQTLGPPTTSTRKSAPLSLAPPTTASLPAQISPPVEEAVLDHPEPVAATLTDRPIPF